jgi:hypothetical protein
MEPPDVLEAHAGQRDSGFAAVAMSLFHRRIAGGNASVRLSASSAPGAACSLRTSSNADIHSGNLMLESIGYVYSIAVYF